MYHNRLDFIVDMHTIYLRPKGFRKDDWAIGLFRMTAQDVEDVIKGFDEEWKKVLEDATVLPPGSAQTDPSDKGKDKVASQTKDTAEAPPLTQKRKDAEEVSLGAPKKKKKTKASKEPTETVLKEDDYEFIATRLQDAMKESFQAMQKS